MLDQKPTYNLATPTPDSISKWTGLLSTTFNKGQLASITKTLAPLFTEFNVTQQWMGHSEDMNDYFSDIHLRNNVKKNDYALFLSRIFADPANLSLYFSTFSPELLAVWRDMATHYYLSVDTISTTLGYECVTSSNKSYYYGYSNDLTFIPEMAWFTPLVSGSWSSKVTILTLSPILRRLMLSCLPPDSDTEEEDTVETPSEEYTIFNGEKSAIAAVPVMRNLFMNGTLQMVKTKLASSMVKRVGQMLNLPEFYTDSDDDADLRTRLLLTAFTLYGSNTIMRSRSTAMSLAPHELLKEIFPHIMYYTHHLTYLLLPMLSKVYTSFTQNSYVTSVLREMKNALIRTADDDRWHTYDSIEKYIRSQETTENLCTYVKPRLIEEYGISNLRDGQIISYANIYHEIGRPYVQGTIYLLASLGMVEIAYTPSLIDDKSSPSPYDGLKYVRITPLGRYAFGLNENYSPGLAPKEEKLFELSDDRLIIRSLSAANPYESLLSDISNPIGNHRYAVTPASFLKSCSSVGNISQKIGLFRQFIAPNPPQNWERFFKSLSDNTGKVNKSADMYSIYDIDPSDHRLHEILATDTIIRKITRRAENYMLLIESGKLSLFRERLKNYGYLV